MVNAYISADMLQWPIAPYAWTDGSMLVLNTLLDVRPSAVIGDARDAPDGDCLLPVEYHTRSQEEMRAFFADL